MRYVGGKGRIAAELAGEIFRVCPDAEVAVEPFMGGGAVTAQLASRYGSVLASDVQPDLVLMWKAVLGGWVPPSVVSESEYRELVSAPPSALRGFVGFGGSFGGKFFGGYARGGFNGTIPRNHQAESARAVARIGAVLREHDVSVSLEHFLNVNVPDGAVVYCDPPYAGTQGYVTGGFDSDVFWEWALELSGRAFVFVSEYSAPAGWDVLWEKRKRQSVALPSQGRDFRVERLFVSGLSADAAGVGK